MPTATSSSHATSATSLKSVFFTCTSNGTEIFTQLPWRHEDSKLMKYSTLPRHPPVPRQQHSLKTWSFHSRSKWPETLTQRPQYNIQSIGTDSGHMPRQLPRHPVVHVIIRRAIQQSWLSWCHPGEHVAQMLEIAICALQVLGCACLAHTNATLASPLGLLATNVAFDLSV